MARKNQGLDVSIRTLPRICILLVTFSHKNCYQHSQQHAELWHILETTVFANSSIWKIYHATKLPMLLNTDESTKLVNYCAHQIFLCRNFAKCRAHQGFFLLTWHHVSTILENF